MQVSGRRPAWPALNTEHCFLPESILTQRLISKGSFIYETF
jgi:hypothetical protein